MKKFFKSKKWIAFFLALLLVVSTGITSSDAFLWATSEQPEEVGAPADTKKAEEIVKQEITASEMEQPTTEQPTTDQPGGEQPTQPTVEQPGGEQSAGEELSEEQPTGEPLSGNDPDELDAKEELSVKAGQRKAKIAASPLAEYNENISMYVGDSKTYTVAEGCEKYEWSSNGSEYVSVTGNGTSGTIKAKKAGKTVKITCKAKNKGGLGWGLIWDTINTYTWTVTVIDAYTTTDQTNAYGYVGFTDGDGSDACKEMIEQMKGDLGGETTDNKRNVWYNLGVASLNFELPRLALPYTAGPDDQPTPGSAPDYVEQVKGAFAANENYSKWIKMADTFGLTSANGAGGYGVPWVSDESGTGKLTWHFNAEINVAKMNYTIHCVDENDQNTILNKDTKDIKIWKKHGEVVYEKDVTPPNIPGYEYVKNESNSITIDKGESNQFLTLTYRPKNVNYDVEFYYKKGEGDSAAYPANADETVTREGLTATDAEVTDADVTKTGYVLDETADNILKAKINGDDINNRTVLKVYLKPKTDKSYTVHYYREGTEESLKPDKVMSSRTFNETYTEDAVEVEGYTPVDPTSQTIKIDADNKELTFFYKANTAKIKFETNDGTFVPDMTGVTDQEITESERTMPITRREGYQLDGWYAKADFSGAKVTALPDKYPAGTTIYYAKWRKEYKIEYYYANHGDDIYSLLHTETESADIGTTINLSDIQPQRTPSNDIGRYVWNDTKGKLSGIVEEDEDLVLQVYFDLEYRVYGVIDTNGTITGNAEFWVPKGRKLSSEQMINFAAKQGYIIESVTIDSSPTLNNGIESTVSVNDKEYSYTSTDQIKTDIKVTATTKALKPALSVARSLASAPANGTAFVPGETIEYTIVVENIGDQLLNNIIVTDSMTGLNETITAGLAPGETKEYNRSYTVKSENVVGTGVVNIVNASAEVSGEFADDFIGTTVDATEIKLQSNVVQSAPNITVEIAADQNQDYRYGKDETVVYTITVTNIGNATIKEIEVEEALTGLEWTVGTLVPGDKAIWPITRSTDDKTATHKVTSADILAGEIYNSVHVSGKDPMNTTVEDEDDVTVRTVDIDASYSITKSLKDYDADKEYAADEILTYQITVTNEGNVTLENIVLTDQLSNTAENAGTVTFDADALAADGLKLNDDNTVTIPKLAAGDDKVLECTYEITRADAAWNTQLDPANAGIKNTASAIADKVKPTTSGNDPVDPTGNPGESETANIEARYTLMVQYQYSDGTTANPTYTDYLKAGDIYAVPVPTITGYNSNYAAVTGTMEARNLVIRVVYSVPATTGGGGGGGGDDTPTTPSTPPTLPTIPQPVVIPAAPVPAGATVVEVPVELTEIGDEEVPLQGARIDIDEDGNAEVVPIDEEEIPLAGMDSPVLHCILHFLLLLAAVLMFLYYMVSTRRWHKKLEDLRDQLPRM